MSTGVAVQQALDDEAARIMEEVGQVFGVPDAMIRSDNRRYEVKCARWLYWWIMYGRGHTLKSCARMTGHDHSSVVKAFKKIENDIEHDKLMANAHGRLKHYFTIKTAEAC